MKKEEKVMDLVVKHISLTEGKYNFNLNQMRFYIMLLTKIDSKNDKTFDYVEIYIRDFEKFFNKRLKSHQIKSLSDDTAISITINTDYGWKKHFLYDTLEYNEKEHKLKVKFAEGIKPYLLQLKERFLQYSIRNIILLTSSYSIRFFELLKQYQTIGKREFEINELYEILEVSKSLRNYPEFKRNILKKAIEEINKFTDIFVDYQEIRNGRKVIKLLFTIEKNPTNSFEKKFEKKITFNQFVAQLRATYSGNGVFFIYQDFDGEIHYLGIDNKGLLYDTGNTVTKTKADEIYKKLFKRYKENEQFKEFIESGKSIALNDSEVTENKISIKDFVKILNNH